MTLSVLRFMFAGSVLHFASLVKPVYHHAQAVRARSVHDDIHLMLTTRAGLQELIKEGMWTSRTEATKLCSSSV